MYGFFLIVFDSMQFEKQCEMFDKDVAIYVEKIQANSREINQIETEIEKHYSVFEKLIEDKKKVQQQILDQSKVMNERVELLKDLISKEEQTCSEYMEIKAQDLSLSTRELQQDQEAIMRM